MSTEWCLRYVPATPKNIEIQRQTPSRPSCASSRVKRTERPSSRYSTPGCCGTPFTYTSIGGCTCSGSSTRERHCILHRMPAVVRRRLLLGLALSALGLAWAWTALAGTALAGNGGIAPVSPDSPNASRTIDAYWVITIFTGMIFVIVESALIVFMIRFRRRGRLRTDEGPQIHGSTRLELIWTVFPVVILALIGVFVFYKLPGIKDTPASAASEANRVQ